MEPNAEWMRNAFVLLADMIDWHKWQQEHGKVEGMNPYTEISRTNVQIVVVG